MADNTNTSVILIIVFILIGISSLLSDARSITVGFLGVLFPLSGVKEPPPLAPLRAGTFALAKEKITTLAKHNTY